MTLDQWAKFCLVNEKNIWIFRRFHWSGPPLVLHSTFGLQFFIFLLLLNILLPEDRFFWVICLVNTVTLWYFYSDTPTQFLATIVELFCAFSSTMRNHFWSSISIETLLKIRYRATLISSSQNLFNLQIYSCWIFIMNTHYHLYVIYILINIILLSGRK